MISSGVSPTYSSLWVSNYDLKNEAHELALPPWASCSCCIPCSYFSPLLVLLYQGPAGAQKVFLWLYCLRVVNSVRTVVAIRRDFFPLRNRQLHETEIVGGRGPAFLNIHINEEVQKMLIGLAKCKQTGDWWEESRWGVSAESNLDLKTGNGIRNKQTETQKGQVETQKGLRVGKMANQMHWGRLRNAPASPPCLGEEIAKWQGTEDGCELAMKCDFLKVRATEGCIISIRFVTVSQPCREPTCVMISHKVL